MMTLKQVVQRNRFDVDDPVVGSRLSMSVFLQKIDDCAEGCMPRRGELHPIAGSRKYATVIDLGPSVAPEVGMPNRVRLGQDSRPTEIPLQGERTAQADPVGGAELDEKSGPLSRCFMKDPKILC